MSEITEKDNKFSLKSVLYDNAVDTLVTTLDKEISENKEETIDLNIGLVEHLSENISLAALTPLNEETYRSERDSLTRHSYAFPSFLNIGTLKNWHTTPSKILNEKSYASEIPMLLPLGANGVGFFMNQKYRKEITNILELMAIKLLSSLPDGLARVTIIDKNGAGQNFPTLLMLNEKITDGKILSEDTEIERELLELKHSMTTVTQSVTSNGFSSIEDYNKNTDEVPQSYRFVFISNFPSGFSKKASEALVALMESGSNAGIYTFTSFTSDPKYGMNQQITGIPLIEFIKNITMFEYQSKPHDYTRRDLMNSNVNIFNSPMVKDQEFKKFMNNTFKIQFEEPKHNVISNIIEDLNDRIQNMNLRPIIDIRKTIPQDFWNGNAGKGVCAQFAKSGIENIYLSLGINQYGEDESTHHGIIGGATGSGKTVTLHDMILHLCMKYSPKDLNFWLLDYKEGTEFAVYKDFPYIQILSMESEIEFGQEVLQKAIDLMEERGAMFKKVGAANLFAYNGKVSEEEKLPRIVIIIDEFQALFPRKAQVTAITNERIDKILRLGRSFGVNLLLSTQTLKGIDMDAQLLSNMPLRIALKMDEKDAIKLFGDDNAAPKFLKYPGEGIYNKSYGNSTSNVHFQAYLALGPAVDELKDILMDHMEKTYDKEEIDSIFAKRFVYNGDLRSTIDSNDIYQNIVSNNLKMEKNKFYLGEPAGLSKEHSFFTFRKEFADNLCVLGMDLLKAASLFHYTTIQLSMSEKAPKIYFGNYNNAYKNTFKDLIQDLKNKGSEIEYFDNPNSEEYVELVYNEFKARLELTEEELKDKEHIYLSHFFIENSKLFTASSFQKDTALAKLKQMIYEGPEFGIHIIIYATSFSTIMSVDLARDMEKFRKKILFKGGNSLKSLGEDGVDVEFSNSSHVAIGSSGKIGEKPFKFKPYINLDLDLD